MAAIIYAKRVKATMSCASLEGNKWWNNNCTQI